MTTAENNVRLLRGLLWLVFLLAATAVIYWLLVIKDGGGEQSPPSATSDAGPSTTAVDQLTEEDRRQLDELIRQRLQGQDGGKR